MYTYITKVTAALLMFYGIASGQAKNHASVLNLPGVQQKIIVYRTIGNIELKIHIFEPGNRKEKTPQPAIIFFSGGGWVKGFPEQFYPHCKYLASRGMVAMSAEYRVKNRHGTSHTACVEDGKAAVRWIRVHAAELGIDTDKITAGGASAGGHVAACTALVDDFEHADENTKICSKPAALVLFNPVVDATHAKWSGLFAEHAKTLSPVHHIKKGLLPAIRFHGTADSTVPYDDVARFTKDAFEGKDLKI